MTDIKLLNWIHNRQVDITWRDGVCVVNVYDKEGLPLVEETALTPRHALREAHKACTGILELG